jgi:rhodanese-related sulfurtransferase
LIQEARTNLNCATASECLNDLPKKAIIIDVREPGEVAEVNAPKSVNIPRGVIEMKIGEHACSADTPIYIHCSTGARATLAAEQLQRVGYTNVIVITCALDQVLSAQADN